MRGGHAAPRGFLRRQQPPAVTAIPVPDPDATVTFIPELDERDQYWLLNGRTVTLGPDRPQADLSRLHRVPGTPALPRRTVSREAVAAGLRARAALTAQAGIPTRVLPALREWAAQDAPAQAAPSAFVADYRTLARFRDTCRIAGFSAAMKRGNA